MKCSAYCYEIQPSQVVLLLRLKSTAAKPTVVNWSFTFGRSSFTWHSRRSEAGQISEGGNWDVDAVWFKVTGGLPIISEGWQAKTLGKKIRVICAVSGNSRPLGIRQRPDRQSRDELSDFYDLVKGWLQVEEKWPQLQHQVFSCYDVVNEST